MKRIFIFTICIALAVSFALVFALYKKNSYQQPDNSENRGFPLTANYSKMKAKGKAFNQYNVAKKYNDSICFLIEMSISSKFNRFFVYNILLDSILASGLVAHGRCNENWLKENRYSNEVNSGCTSLGKYKVGQPYSGKFGLAYRLYGLDSSNDKAFARSIVLHGHNCVPTQTSTREICQSDGCPTVAPQFLYQLKELIDGSAKPILLWIYE